MAYLAFSDDLFILEVLTEVPDTHTESPVRSVKIFGFSGSLTNSLLCAVRRLAWLPLCSAGLVPAAPTGEEETSVRYDPAQPGQSSGAIRAGQGTTVPPCPALQRTLC